MKFAVFVALTLVILVSLLGMSEACKCAPPKPEDEHICGSNGDVFHSRCMFFCASLMNPVLGAEYCSGYTDLFGQWNTGFYCPQMGSVHAVYCCGTPTFKYCCTTRQISTEVTEEDMSSVFIPGTPVIVGMVCGVVAAILLVIVASCFLCSCCCCYAYRRKRRESRDTRSLEGESRATDGVYRLTNSGSTTSTNVSTMYRSVPSSMATVSTPLETAEWTPPPAQTQTVQQMPMPNQLYRNPANNLDILSRSYEPSYGYADTSSLPPPPVMYTATATATLPRLTGSQRQNQFRCRTPPAAFVAVPYTLTNVLLSSSPYENVPSSIMVPTMGPRSVSLSQGIGYSNSPMTLAGLPPTPPRQAPAVPRSILRNANPNANYKNSDFSVTVSKNNDLMVSYPNNFWGLDDDDEDDDEDVERQLNQRCQSGDKISDPWNEEFQVDKLYDSCNNECPLLEMDLDSRL